MDTQPTNDGEEIAIEQCAAPRTAKQSTAMSLIGEYGRLTTDGSLDVSDVISHIDSQRGYIEETMGKYGRVARYATDVDEPSIKVVREPSGRGGDVQKAVYQLIEDHATLNPDGTVDIESIAEHDVDGRTFDSKVIARNVARAVQVQMPYEERPDHLRNTMESSPQEYDDEINVGGTFDDPVLNRLFDESDVPSDPVAAFRRGWNLRDSLEQHES
jgi:hypothetical protein